MFYPSVVEVDVILIHNNYDITACEFKGRPTDIFSDLFKFLDTPPGTISINPYSPKDLDAREYGNVGLPLKLVKHSNTFLELLDNPFCNIGYLNKVLTHIALLENLFFSINNWLNIALIHYSPKSLKILSDNFIEIPFTKYDRCRNNINSIICLSKDVARYKYNLIYNIKGLKNNITSKHFKELAEKIVDKKYDEYKRHECLTHNEVKKYNCQKIIILTPTLKTVVDKVKKVLWETILKINDAEIVFIGTKESCEDVGKILGLKPDNICTNITDNECREVSTNNMIVKYCQISYVKPDYMVLHKHEIISKPENTCFIILSEFPKHMLVEFIEYMYNRYEDSVTPRIFVLVPKKPIPTNYVNAKEGLLKLEDNHIIDIKNRYGSVRSQRFYCLQSLDDVISMGDCK